MQTVMVVKDMVTTEVASQYFQHISERIRPGNTIEKLNGKKMNDFVYIIVLVLFLIGFFVSKSGNGRGAEGLVNGCIGILIILSALITLITYWAVT